MLDIEEQEILRNGLLENALAILEQANQEGQNVLVHW
jgi:protein-tyrosine phosphatase